MKKIFLLILGVFLFVRLQNVNAENLIMTYSGNPYYVISGNGEYHSSIVTYFELNGDVAYCVEPGVLVTDFNYIEEDINTLPYSPEKINIIKLIGYYGYEYPNHQTNSYRMATQALIWENLTGKTVTFSTEKYGNGNVIDVTSEKNEIMRLVNNHYLLPNINDNLTLSLNADNVLIDSNNVLDNFEIISENQDLRISKEENNLHIMSNKIGDYTITLRRKKYDNKQTLLYIASNGQSQKLVKLRYDDNIELKINIHIVGGKVNLTKLDSETKNNISLGNASLLNAKYGLFDMNNNLITELLTNELGEASVDKLEFGNYYLQEINSSYGYLVDPKKYEFIINKDNLLINISTFEDLIKKDVTFIKTIEGDMSLLDGEENIIFEIYFQNNNELYKKVETNKDGVAKIKLPYGIYKIHQVNTNEGYLKGEDFTFIIDENTDELYKVIYDKKVRGKINIHKSDMDTNINLKDAFIEVYKTDDLIYSGYTDEFGNIELNNLEVGKYKIIEKIAPNDYLLDNQEYFVDINNDITDVLVEIKNKHEEIQVPSTGLNKSNYLKLISIGVMIIGLYFILIGFYHKKINY